ncbi:putative quinol monooxygenase [Ahrensia sp. 13_GOM-1096m]|uniref:putative quinol monooxygenase n=1 Tax=Ahrensia sp. 13_GOM-1096m TaxID=1380380 RepID=UPI000683F2CF|nr:antibiotic biosynthesis monooxygenase [Ahrensia sp. 13_GOM-1096m]
MTLNSQKPDLNEGNIHLTGYIDVPVDRLYDVLGAMNTHINLTRGELGCIYFVMERDVSNSNHLNVEEIFKDRAAFEHHKERSAASDWAQTTQNIDRHFKIREI